MLKYFIKHINNFKPRQDYFIKKEFFLPKFFHLKLKESPIKPAPEKKSNDNINNSPKKIPFSVIYKNLKPYFTKGNIKKYLFYSLALTILSKGLVSIVIILLINKGTILP